MNLVITTGCPNSGWEMALPILQQFRLETAGVSATLWIDEYFQITGATDLLQIRQPLQPDSSWGEHVAALLPKNSSSPVLLADSRNIWLLDFWAQQFPQARFLLLFTCAETALAHALQLDVDPHQFIEQWQAANNQLLKFHRRHRQHSLLLDAEAVVQHPLALEGICRRIGLTLKQAANIATQALPPSAVERLIAEYLLATQPAVHALQMELEASAQPLGDSLPIIQLQPAEVIDGYRQRQASQRKLQAQLEQTILKNRQIEKAHKQHDAAQQEIKLQLEQARQTLQKLEPTHRETTQENELLLLQLHQVQEELECYFLKWQELSDAQESELKTRDAQRNNIPPKSSWSFAIPSVVGNFNKKRKERKKLQKQIDLLKLSGLFDEAWYLSAYPDVARDGMEPVKHYLSYGAAEGRNPSPSFNTHTYLAANPDVAAEGMNPLVHFVKYGKAERRSTNASRSAAWR
jgi:hypothetical protein